MSETPFQPNKDTSHPPIASPAFTPGTPEPAVRSNAKRNVLIIAGVVVLITVAVAVTIILDTKNFLSNNKFLQSIRNKTGIQDTESHVLESLFSIQTADVNVDLATSGPMFASKSEVTSNFSGSFDPKGGDNGSYSFSYKIIDANGNALAPTSFSVINVASNTYFQIAGLPTLFLISGALNEHWIDISANVKKASFDFPVINKQQTLEELKKHSVFSVEDNLGSEKLNGMDTNHYRLKVNASELASFTKAFVKNLNGSMSEQEVDQLVQSISFENVEVWVGANNFFPYKIVVDLSTHKNEAVSMKDGSLSATIIFSKLDESKNISAPEKFQTLPEALTPQIQSFVGGLFDKAIGMIFQNFPSVQGLPDSDGDGVNDASEIILGTDIHKKDSNDNGVSDKEELSVKLGDARDGDADGLSDTLEAWYGTDPKKPDSDGDGFTDGEEVISGFNPKGPGKIFP